MHEKVKRRIIGAVILIGLLSAATPFFIIHEKEKKLAGREFFIHKQTKTVAIPKNPIRETPAVATARMNTSEGTMSKAETLTIETTPTQSPQSVPTSSSTSSGNTPSDNTQTQSSQQTTPTDKTIAQIRQLRLAIQELEKEQKKLQLYSRNVAQAKRLLKMTSKDQNKNADQNKKMEKQKQSQQVEPLSFPEVHSNNLKPQPTFKSKKIWTVQLGTFSNPENAKRLRVRLNRQGYPTRVKLFTRLGISYSTVYVGEEQTQTKAMHLAALLQQKYHLKGIVRPKKITTKRKIKVPHRQTSVAHHHHQLTEQDLAKLVPQKKAKLSKSRHLDLIPYLGPQLPSEKKKARLWVVQVGSYKDMQSAKQLADRLELQGFSAYVNKLVNKKKKFRYNVYVGPEVAEDSAEILSAILKKRMHLSGHVKPITNINEVI